MTWIARWIARRWLRIDSWLRGETWPDAWVIYWSAVIPLYIEDAVREMPARVYLPSVALPPYDGQFHGTVQMIRDGGAWEQEPT